MKYEQVVEAVNKLLPQYRTKLTVRQIYYRLISPPYQLFPNAVKFYKGFDHILTRAREKGDVDWRAIEDSARAERGGDPNTSDDPQEYVESLFNILNERYYKKAHWATQPKYVEVWVEKVALANLFMEACSGLFVVVFPSRGYSSFTKVMEATERLSDEKPNVILHFTDHDPSGLDMSEDLRKRFDEYAGLDLEVRRIALTYGQVQQLHLPSNPTKSTDARSPSYVSQYGNECWELVAVPTDELQKWIREAVESEIDREAWDSLDAEEEDEKTAISEALKPEEKLLIEIRQRVVKKLESEPE